VLAGDSRPIQLINNLAYNVPCLLPQVLYYKPLLIGLSVVVGGIMLGVVVGMVVRAWPAPKKGGRPIVPGSGISTRFTSP
jgi:hypothetical protein